MQPAPPWLGARVLNASRSQQANPHQQHHVRGVGTDSATSEDSLGNTVGEIASLQKVNPDFFKL